MKVLRFLPALIVCAADGRAAVSESDASRLGRELTPLGAEAKANADGSIPAWNGGIQSPPAGYKVGDHHPDPFATDQPLYTVTAAALAQHEARLTTGHVAVLKAYPDYKLIVYPSRRSASNPQRVYDATRKNATTGQLISNGNGIKDAL